MWLSMFGFSQHPGHSLDWLFQKRFQEASIRALLVAKEASYQSMANLTFVLCAGHMAVFVCNFLMHF